MRTYVDGSDVALGLFICIIIYAVGIMIERRRDKKYLDEIEQYKKDKR